MRSALVLALAAGCGFHIPGGSSTGDGGPPGDAADGMIGTDVPVDMPVDMPIDMTPLPGDQDGDTILDTLDNCVAVANTDQRNHDSDPFGDVCDGCPHLASPNDPDGDGDGVGDACDPRPANNADRRKLWVGFYDTNDIAGWGGQGTFTIATVGANGYLKQATANISGWAPPGNVNVPFVMTELVVDDLINTNGSIGVAVNTPTNGQYECAIAKNGSNVNVRAREQGAQSQSTGWAGTFVVNSRITLRLDLATDVDCRAIQGASNVQQVASTNGDPTGQTYLGTEGFAARFDYLFVVEQAP